MGSTQFTGDKKAPVVSLLAPLERRFIAWAVPKVPAWLRSHHLTYMTVVWSALLPLASFAAAYTEALSWLWVAATAVFMQWVTDCLDGAVGRARNEGVRRWGFYMDHFLDYIFMACACGHFYFVVQEPWRDLYLLLVPLYAAFEVNSWLEYGATGTFRITYSGLGPTEVRLIVILSDVLFICGLGEAFTRHVLPLLMLVMVLLLLVLVKGASRRIWELDMREKGSVQ